ncbi:MAG: hypothetical protein PF505_12505, partial [Vallitaleaceae bacterium]|nr:hypothetical protein [Vallitaleaceae bacterium]
MDYNRDSYTSEYIYDYKFLSRFNILLLVFHMLFLFLFFYAEYYILAIVNVFSVTYYIFFLRYTKNNLKVYARFTFIEVIIHATAVVLLMGWGYGFQNYFFALVPIFYFISHFGDGHKEDSKTSFYNSVLIGVLLIILKGITYYVEPLYILKNDWVRFLISQMNIVIAVAFIIYFVKEYQMVVQTNEKIIRDIAQTDQLTRVYNRYYMTKIINKSLSEDSIM